MTNPGGNYPGRQIGIGTTKNGLPAFTYLVTGRSPSSQQRYASPPLIGPSGISIRIKPINPDEPFDQFRHYQAVVVDPETGFVFVTNNEATVVPAYEAIKFHEKRDEDTHERIRRMLAAIGPEYDTKEKPTSRIAGAIFPLILPFRNDGHLWITDKKDQAFGYGWPLLTKRDYGKLYLVQTYDGNVDYSNLDIHLLGSDKLSFRPEAITAQDLAEELYEITDYIDPDPKRGDLKACVIAGVKNGRGPGGWEIARKNRHPVE